MFFFNTQIQDEMQASAFKGRVFTDERHLFEFSGILLIFVNVVIFQYSGEHMWEDADVCQGFKYVHSH